MSDDLLENLESYKAQLQQVEAALIAEPDNEELIKLKEDLVEVIALTEDLAAGPSKPASTFESTKHRGSPNEQSQDEDLDELLEVARASGNLDPTKPVKDWKVGDQCLAMWSKNGQYHLAVVDGISEGKAAVTFLKWNTPETNFLYQLRLPGDEAAKKNYAFDPKPKRKAEWQLEKEKRKKKAQKRMQKQKEMEAAKEGEKQKWKHFNTKAMAKSYKGMKKAGSIFTSSKSQEGEIGDEVSGREMTKYQQQAKFFSRGGDRMESLF